MKILGIIPARAGSKRVKHKNFRPFANTTLVDLAINQAIKSNKITNIVVSSDSMEVLAKSSVYPNVKFLSRPIKISGDRAPAIEYVNHALNELENNFFFDLIVILQPSSPFRNEIDIDKCIDILISEPDADSCVSVARVDHMVHPLKLKTVENNVLRPYIEPEQGRFASHELPDIYARNGAVYVTRRDVILKYDNVIGQTSLAYEMSELTSIDINTEVDFEFSEYLYRRNAEK